MPTYRVLQAQLTWKMIEIEADSPAEALSEAQTNGQDYYWEDDNGYLENDQDLESYRVYDENDDCLIAVDAEETA